LKGNNVHFFPALRARLGFATFFWKVAKKRNPNNPVDPVQINIFSAIYREPKDWCQENVTQDKWLITVIWS
jgi:hypothetical protein